MIEYTEDSFGHYYRLVIEKDHGILGLDGESTEWIGPFPSREVTEKQAEFDLDFQEGLFDIDRLLDETKIL